MYLIKIDHLIYSLVIFQKMLLYSEVVKRTLISDSPISGLEVTTANWPELSSPSSSNKYKVSRFPQRKTGWKLPAHGGLKGGGNESSYSILYF